MANFDFDAVTPDDHGVIVRALYWAIAAIEVVSKGEQANVGVADEAEPMRAILRKMTGDKDAAAGRTVIDLGLKIQQARRGDTRD